MTLYHHNEHWLTLVPVNHSYSPREQVAELQRALLFQNDFIQSLCRQALMDFCGSALSQVSMVDLQRAQADFLAACTKTNNFQHYINRFLTGHDDNIELTLAKKILTRLAIFEAARRDDGDPLLSADEIKTQYLQFQKRVEHVVELILSQELSVRKINSAQMDNDPLRKIEQALRQNSAAMRETKTKRNTKQQQAAEKLAYIQQLTAKKLQIKSDYQAQLNTFK